ncbi:unnamed protein product [Urochloa decumbens]|uniref:Bifunctional inhibitor/plant lipid transfer protein/seed storage helical domain-containing protein n=1 Tax=Urochloa decumbens TaxID=240449 RepID=A0ABC9G998_9POAL
MAPSNNRFLILLLAAIAVAAANLPPSAAIRAEAEAEPTAAAPSPANGDVLHPAAEFTIPDLPIPALLPCPPLFPKIPLIPCYKEPSPPPEIKECRPSLEKLMRPCAGFLTNSSIFAPTSECCAAFDPFYEDKAVLACLCHLTNGDVARLLPAPLNRRRIVPLLISCDFQITPNALSDACDTLRKEDGIPPMDLPSSPPSA